MRPTIVTPAEGRHNANLEASRGRLITGATYKNLSTVIITPTRGGNSLSPRWVQSQMGLMKPMNQKVYDRFWAAGMEVGDAYNQVIQAIIDHPELSKWRYIVTIEDDVMPPQDGLLKLYESIEGSPYSVVGGLYWTKGEAGQPMIYGDPAILPRNYIPQPPRPDSLQECCGMGQGFHIYRMKMFKDPRIPKPWFKTLQEFIPGQGARAFSQDLYFYQAAAQAGYRFACATSIKCGHYDAQEDMIW